MVCKAPTRCVSAVLVAVLAAPALAACTSFPTPTSSTSPAPTSRPATSLSQFPTVTVEAGQTEVNVRVGDNISFGIPDEVAEWTITSSEPGIVQAGSDSGSAVAQPWAFALKSGEAFVLIDGGDYEYAWTVRVTVAP